MAYEPKQFPACELRDAVEHLKPIPDSKYVGLCAESETVRAGAFLLGPKAFLKLDQIRGRTPAEVWAAFDAEVDRLVYGLLEPQGKRYGVQI